MCHYFDPQQFPRGRALLRQVICENNNRRALRTLFTYQRTGRVGCWVFWMHRWETRGTWTSRNSTGFFENFRPDDPEVLNVVGAGLVFYDDKNEPLLENIPNMKTKNNYECTYAEEWGHGGVYFRESVGGLFRLVRLKNHDRDLNMTKL